jgi:hypothetical protein
MMLYTFVGAHCTSPIRHCHSRLTTASSPLIIRVVHQVLEPGTGLSNTSFLLSFITSVWIYDGSYDDAENAD